MTDFSADKLRALVTEIGPLPVSESWMYSAIRHCQRNMDFECHDGGEEPDRQSGGAFAKLANMLPAILAMAEREKRMREALESVLKVRVNRDDNIWAGADRCRDIARRALGEEKA